MPQNVLKMSTVSSATNRETDVLFITDVFTNYIKTYIFILSQVLHPGYKDIIMRKIVQFYM